MEYLPYKIDHNSNTSEPYLNECGSFLVYPSIEQTLEFLHIEAKKFIIRKAGEEKSEKCTYDFDTPLESIELGYFIRKLDDNLGYTLCEKIIDSNSGIYGLLTTYYTSKVLAYYKYMKNSVSVHKRPVKREVKIDTKVTSYCDVLRELQTKGQHTLKKTGVQLVPEEILPELPDVPEDVDELFEPHQEIEGEYILPIVQSGVDPAIITAQMADIIDDTLDREYWEQLEEYYDEDFIDYNEIDNWCLEDCYVDELVKKKSE